MFTGWSGAGGCTGTSTCVFTSIAAAKAVTATFALEVYTITYDANEGTLAGTEDLSYTYGDAPITEPADPSRTGYDFVDWYSDAGLTTLAVWPLTPTGDTTVYAKWSATVTFNENGGDALSCAANQTSSIDNDALATNLCTRTGYEFTGWNTAATGPGTPYADEGLYDFASDGSDVLYARWRVLKFDVTFDENGGAPVSDLTNKDYSSGVTLPTPSRTGYTFDGWSADGGATLVPAGPFTIPASDTDFVAQWTINGFVVTATSGTGGTVDIAGGSYSYHVGPTITATPSAGYTFSAWTGGGSVCTTNPVCDLSLIDTNYPSLVATFTINTFDVVASAGTGGSVDSTTGIYNYHDGPTITATANANYTFDSWTGGGSVCTTNPVCDLSLIDTDYPSLVATFNIDSFAIAATAGIGGTVSSAGGNYDYHDGPTITATPSAGYTFNAWTGGGSVCTTNPVCDLSLIDTNYPSLVATFTVDTIDVTVTIVGEGDVTDGPEGELACDEANDPCTESYDYNTTVTLTAVAATGYRFDGWSGAGGCTGTSTCVFTSIAAAKAATATFAETTAPIISVESVDMVAATTAKLNFSSSESGTYYFLVLSQTASAPSASTIRLQGAAATKGSGPANATNTVTMTGMTASTAYTVYLIVEDAAGNRSSVVDADFTTTAAPGLTFPLYTTGASVSGVPQVGKTLSAMAGVWRGGASFTYQWYRCTQSVNLSRGSEVPAGCTEISGATGRQYLLTSADRSSHITVRVTGTSRGASNPIFTSSTPRAVR